MGPFPFGFSTLGSNTLGSTFGFILLYTLGLNYSKHSFCARIECDALSAGRGFGNLQMFWQVLHVCAYLRTLNGLIFMWAAENNELNPEPNCWETIEDALTGVFGAMKAVRTKQQLVSIN